MAVRSFGLTITAAALLALGTAGAAAQDNLTPEVGETTTTATQATEPRDEGFDDWGLLGLLGLAGLAGLRRQPARTVVEERHDGTVTRRP